MLIKAVDDSISKQNTYAGKTENRQNQVVCTTEKVESADKAEASKRSGTSEGPHDEYIPSGDKPDKSAGIYRLEKDETGKQRIVFDRPGSDKINEQVSEAKHQEKAELPEIAAEPDNDSEKPEQAENSKKIDYKKGETKCTVNTDKVDSEIKKLKEEKQQLEQQLKSANDDDKRKELEQRLSLVNSELNTKDNDTYRRQNSAFTNS